MYTHLWTALVFLGIFFYYLQAVINELQKLHNESRSNSCIEHAIAIMEEEQAPENLSKDISSISLTGNDKKVCATFYYIRGLPFSRRKVNAYRSCTM